MPVVSGFRNVVKGSRFAHFSTATCATGTAVRVGDGWDYQSVEEHQRCSNEK